MVHNLIDRKGAAFVKMRARDFLQVTIDRPYSEWRQLVADEVQPLDRYNQWAIEGEIRVGPFLKVKPSGKVLGHEGRHRAAALIDAGGEDMLVGIVMTDDQGAAHRGRYGSRDVPILLEGEFPEWPSRARRDVTFEIDDVLAVVKQKYPALEEG